MTETFDFYGFIVTLTSDRDDVVREVTRDFAWFVIPPARSDRQREPDMRVSISFEAPSYSTLPAVPASVLTPRNISFRDGDVSYVDYFGRGLAIVNTKAGTCDIYGTDFDLVREIAYLFLLSTVGQYLDSKGLHRIHAMGVNYKGHGILLLLPSGGGKSTMTMELLKHPDLTLLSEDTPLIDRKGRIHPFPLRLGFRNDGGTEVPEDQRRTLQRMEFDPKTFVDISFFRHRLSDAVDPGLILVGERNLGSESSIVPLSKRRSLKAMIKYLVVGLGVYQGLEFLLERGLWEVTGKAGVAASRMRNAVALMRRAPSYKFVLGRDTTKNSATLIDFIKRRYD
ncbi:MAG TPA: hypothetical protein VFX40_04095 [Gemmatimonadaceae bacterium]|nr:hypothetical protein [Gemmatimonadaceae bacterium]